MRLMAEVFIPVLLVGYLIAAVAVAGGQEGLVTSCEGSYKGRMLTPDDLATVLNNHRAWLNSGRELNDPQRANLCQARLDKANLHEARLEWANLQGADLRWANLEWAELGGASLQGAVLFEAHLQMAGLFGANLQDALLESANLQGADLRWANLQGAGLFMANLQGAVLFDANLQDATLFGANLQGTVYEPNPGKLPNFWILTDPRNHLETLVFRRSPAALMTLREAFKKGGMRTQERQLTYAIEHTRRLRAWDPSGHDPFGQDSRPWLEKLAGKSESLFSYVLFELPSHYGMAPGRALWGLLSLIPGFALFYWIALQNTNSQSGLWMIVPADRLTRGRGHERIVRIRPQTAKTWWGHLMDECRLFRTSLYFSLLSAFHLGWREFNVGTWIARMQPREYTLRATGWVRTVSGIQSLLSVYLLALWVLTYFGRPFE